jgi:nuclear cap-binding protein subunit 1
VPFSAEGRELAALLRRKAPDEELQPVIDRIQKAAREAGLDPVIASADVFMTSVCWVGSKSLSHVLACVERTKDRLVNAGASSGDPEAARAQIIAAVMAYWHAQPGVAISIVEKLLNYSILTPFSVVQWALVGSSHASDVAISGSDGPRSGHTLAQAHVFELVFNTVAKVTGRVRQVHGSVGGLANGATVTAEGGVAAVVADPESEELRSREVMAMRELFRALDDALVSWAGGSKDEMMEEGDGSSEEEALVRRWAARWLRVFRRRSALEEAFLKEAAEKAAALKAQKAENGENGEDAS